MKMRGMKKKSFFCLLSPESRQRAAAAGGGGSIMTRFIMVSAQYNKTGFVIIKKDTK